MADPVGLVSLALTGVGKATTVSRLRKKRRKVIKALAAEAEAGDLKMRNAIASNSGDAEPYRAVLSPLLDESTVLLERFAQQKPLKALTDALDDVPEDIDAARKLIDAFKAADAAIELYCKLRRIHDGVGAGNDATLSRIHDLQRDVARLEKTLQRCIISVVFFVTGQPA